MISRADLDAARAPFAAFAVIGVGWGGFAAQVPEIKARIGAGDAAFGGAMLVAAFGAIMALWLAPLADRWMARRAMLVPALCMLCGFVLAGMADVHIEHLIEITVVHVTLPVDTELIGAH